MSKFKEGDMRYVYKGERLIPNVAVPVREYDDKGNLLGTYVGYYNYRKYTMTLYPDYSGPYVAKAGGLKKKVISAGILRRQEIKAPTESAAAKSQTSRLRKLPIEGQEKIKF